MTADFPVVWSDPADAELAWEREDMHTPFALTPLSGDYFQAVIEGFNRNFRELKLPFTVLCEVFNYYAYMARRLFISEEELKAMSDRTTKLRRQWLPRLRSFWEEDALPQLMSIYDQIDSNDVEAIDLDGLAVKVTEVWAHVPAAYRLHSMTTAGAYGALDQLADLYESLIPEAHPGEAFGLVQGLPSELQKVQADIYHLAKAAGAIPAVADLIRGGASLEVIEKADGGGEFSAALDSFLELHGHLGHAFDDLTLSSWREEPSLVLDEVRKRLLDLPEDPEVRRLRLREDAERSLAVAREKLADRPEEFEKLEEAVRLAEAVGPLTEEHNYWLDRKLQTAARRFFTRVGVRLVSEGLIDQPEDVYMLHIEEVAETAEQRIDRRAVVAERKADLERWEKVSPPRYLGKPRKEPTMGRFGTPVVSAEKEIGIDGAVGSIRGIGATSGVARGSARVVRGPDDFGKVQSGDILVCPSSNPSWVPLFGVIGGVVTNSGGVTSHAAVVAREFGIPAVVGTGSATEVIPDGALVEVDAGAGEVRFL